MAGADGATTEVTVGLNLRGRFNRDRRWRDARGEIGTTLIHEPNHVSQRGIVAQFAAVITRNAVDLADGGEHLCLLDGIDAKVGFEIEIQIQHVPGIASLFDREVHNALFHRVADTRCPSDRRWCC